MQFHFFSNDLMATLPLRSRIRRLTHIDIMIQLNMASSCLEFGIVDPIIVESFGNPLQAILPSLKIWGRRLHLLDIMLTEICGWFQASKPEDR